MASVPNAKESLPGDQPLTADVSRPVLLEKDGQAVAVLLSINEYERYQKLLAAAQLLSAAEARRATDRALFGDLVGCALTSDEPVWSPQPYPQWRVPYRLFDGRLLAIVHVDAQTGAVALTDEERTQLLDKLEQLVTTAHVPA
jgi:hypothetical protein